MFKVKLFEAFSKEDPIITLYHGTCDLLRSKIVDQDGALRPRPDNRYVYLTTDKKVAEKYAKAWTAWSIMDAAPQLKMQPNYHGVIFTFQVLKSLIEEDPYNPEGEPNQYRIEGDIYPDDAEIERIEFKDLHNKTVLMQNYAYWIGVARATDEG